MKSAIPQCAAVLLSGVLALLHTTDSLAQPAAPATNQAALRVLIITGGHDHEAAFYGLFDGYQDLGWPAVSDSTVAFKQDIRAKYDVLVFYNFTRDLDDSAKKNLRDFVESGKGIEILGVAANNDFSNPAPEVRETQICYMRELIRMTADYGISHLIPRYD
jgi:hypothetical protein